MSDHDLVLRDQLIDSHQQLSRFIARTSRHLRGTLVDALDEGGRADVRQHSYRSWGAGVALGLLGPVYAEISPDPHSWLWSRLTGGQAGQSTEPAIIRGRRLEAEERLENALLMVPVAAAVAGSDPSTCMSLIWRSVKVVSGIMESAIAIGQQLGSDPGVLVSAADESALTRVGERVQLRFVSDAQLGRQR